MTFDIACSLFIVFAAWWARGIKEKVSKIDDHEQHMNEFAEAVAKLNNLPCTNHEHSIGRHDQEPGKIESRMTKVETSVEYEGGSRPGKKQIL